MLNRLLTASCLFAFSIPMLHAQATGTAIRTADLQIGLGFVIAQGDYEPQRLKGGAFYTTLDFTSHLGGEFVIHQANTPTSDSLYERTYEIGPRYHRTYGPFAPYVKAMYGRGVFNFPNNVANLAYNVFAFGGGVDFAALPWLNVRADYEYQDWLSFPPTGLNPQVFTIGVAYHFPNGMRRNRHF